MAYTGKGFRPTRWQQRWEGGVEAASTMTGDETLDGSAANILARDPDGADRVLTLEAEESSDGLMHWIANGGTGGFTLDVQDDSSASVIVLQNGDGVLVACDGSAWTAYVSQTGSVVIADPGDAGAIPVTSSGTVAMTTVGASETRTVAIPTFAGQTLSLIHSVDGGDVDVTFASAINQAGNTAAAFAEVADFLALEAADIGGALFWRVVVNDGAVLS